MNIFVIGGAGYIGHHVVRELLDNKHEVTIFDNISSGRRENVFSDATLIEGDILDIEALEKAMSTGFDAIIHLGALKAAGESMTEPEKYSVNNITGTINILNAASKFKINKFIFSSTAQFMDLLNIFLLMKSIQLNLKTIMDSQNWKLKEY